MRSDQPPAVATWLLKQFGCSPQNEAILGDLIEQYRNGRHSLLALLSIVLDFEVRFGRSGYCFRTRDPQLAFPSIFLFAVGGKYSRHFLGRWTGRRASSQFVYLKKESDDSYSPAATCNVVVEAFWL